MLERFKTMSAEEQQQFLARMKERGGDTSPFEALMTAGPAAGAKPAQGAQAQTIDALFAPLPAVESRGRAWLFVDQQLKPVNLRLGISDGTYTELISVGADFTTPGNQPTGLQENLEVVTGVTGVTATRTVQQPQGTGNPLMPGRGPGGRGPGR